MQSSQHISISKIKNTYFDLAVTPKKHQIHVLMQLHITDVTTTHMDDVITLLQTHLPSVLTSTCFNEEQLPFSQEVKSTEIGHLFEHIMLEYLCQGKMREGYTEALFAGITTWDWNKDTYGTFHITLHMTKNEHIYFSRALKKSILLLQHILVYHQNRASKIVGYLLN